jgi:hypothetical protein
VKALKQHIRIDGATNSRLRVDEPDCTMAVEAPHKTYFAAAERALAVVPNGNVSERLLRAVTHAQERVLVSPALN